VSSPVRAAADGVYVIVKGMFLFGLCVYIFQENVARLKNAPGERMA
jgi:hypothetical protein